MAITSDKRAATKVDFDNSKERPISVPSPSMACCSSAVKPNLCMYASSTRTAELVKVQKALKEPLLKLQRATDTCWLSHQPVVDALRRSYHLLRASTTGWCDSQQVDSPQKRSVLKYIQNGGVTIFNPTH